MQTTDREDFDALIRKLCLGFDKLPAPDRIEAYWSGLQKMSLSQLSRCIDHALSENGEERLPTVPQMWAIFRELRRSGPNAVEEASPADKPVASMQEQLCAYAVRHLNLSRSELARPWDFRYREWYVDGKRQSELTSVLIERDHGTITRVSVAEMLADTQGHAVMLASFRPSARPKTQSQVIAEIQGRASVDKPVNMPSHAFEEDPNW